jgi:hypothetical protein
MKIDRTVDKSVAFRSHRDFRALAGQVSESRQTSEWPGSQNARTGQLRITLAQLLRRTTMLDLMRTGGLLVASVLRAQDQSAGRIRTASERTRASQEKLPGAAHQGCFES